jgi:hypothetical protein
VGRWVKTDRRYNQPYRLTGYAKRVILKWTGLTLAWVLANAMLASAHLGVLILVTTAVLAGYAVRSIRRGRKPRLTTTTLPPTIPAPAQWQFNPPPGWPVPPPGWSPPQGWQPDPSWPPAPPGWQLWIQAPPRGAAGERNSRFIPQDVKIAVSVRDQGRCVQCGSSDDLHYDHKVPWSRGGTNTVNNIQLLCGRCNRRKGADDIPAR